MVRAAAVGGERGAPSRRRRIGPLELVAGALARIHRGGLAALGLWLVCGAGFTAAQALLQAAGVTFGPEAASPGYVAYVVAGAVVVGLAGALYLRLFIAGREGWLAPDVRLFQCAGLLALAQVAMNLMSLVLAREIAAGAEGTGDPPLALAAFLAEVALVVILAKLVLWPPGRLTGRRDVTPARSWRLMRGALAGLFLAYLIFLGPIWVLLASNLWLERLGLELATIGRIALRAFGGQAWLVIGQALAATLYALRVEAPDGVAEVFD